MRFLIYAQSSKIYIHPFTTCLGWNMNRTSARRLMKAEKLPKVLELRRQGLSYEKIGNQLGIHFTTAHHWVRDLMRELAQQASETAEEVRQLEEQRLDEMLEPLWPKAQAGDIRADEMVLRIMERRARLRGLDAPTKVEGRISLPDSELLLLARTYGLSVSPELEKELSGIPTPPPYLESINGETEDECQHGRSLGFDGPPEFSGVRQDSATGGEPETEVV